METAWRARPALLGGGAAGLLAFLVYLRTLAPSIPSEDGAELIAAAYSLGIAHPPGYPLWCLLGRAFVALVPFGEVAWRLNLMSAVFAGLTVSSVYAIAYTLRGFIESARVLDDWESWGSVAEKALERLIRRTELTGGRLPVVAVIVRPISSPTRDTVTGCVSVVNRSGRRIDMTALGSCM